MNNQWFCVYTINKDKNCDELKLDLKNKGYEFNYNIDKRSLANIENKRIREHCVDRCFFDDLSEIVQETFNYGSEYTECETYEEKLERERLAKLAEKNKPFIKKDKIWNALKLELTKEEMKEITTYDVAYEKDNYYDFSLIEKTILDYINFRIDEKIFEEWCWLCMRVYADECIKKDQELNDLYYRISDVFDSWLFELGREGELFENCKENFCQISYINHLIENKKAKKSRDYEKNNIVIYSCFESYIKDKQFYKICIVDKKNKKINLKYVYDPKCNIDLYVTDMSKEDFDDILSCYGDDYVYDENLSELDQLK